MAKLKRHLEFSGGCRRCKPIERHLDVARGEAEADRDRDGNEAHMADDSPAQFGRQLRAAR